MPILIVILKILSILAYGWRVVMVWRLKKEDSSLKVQFDLFSGIEVAAGFAVALIGWLAVLDESTYAFTAGLNAVAIVLTLTHNYRIIIAGDRKIMFCMKIFDLKKIKGMRTGRFSLYIWTKENDRYMVIVPLTKNTTVKKMKYLK